VCCCPWHSIWRGSLCICYCLFILITTSMFLENFPTLDVTSYLLLGANAWEWWYKIQLSRCIWICDVIQRIQVSWANQMWIYLLKLFKWTVLKFQRCQLQSTKLYLFAGWSCFIISEGKIWKKNSWFTFYWSQLATCICNNANNNRNLVFCYHQFCDYIQLHHLQLFLQLWTTFEISTTILWLHYHYWRFHVSMWMIFMCIFIQEHGRKSH